MALPLSFSPQLEVLVGIIVALIFVAAFLAILFSAFIALGAARLLYLGGSWFVRNAGRSFLPNRLPEFEPTVLSGKLSLIIDNFSFSSAFLVELESHDLSSDDLGDATIRVTSARVRSAKS